MGNMNLTETYIRTLSDADLAPHEIQDIIDNIELITDDYYKILLDLCSSEYNSIAFQCAIDDPKIHNLSAIQLNSIGEMLDEKRSTSSEWAEGSDAFSEIFILNPILKITPLHDHKKRKVELAVGDSGENLSQEALSSLHKATP